MIIRETALTDIPQIQVVRHAVKENTLSDPSLVPDKDLADYITNRGKGWVCIVGDVIVGFAIADLVEDNIWALFVHPEHEKKGIGKQLHDTMLYWYFNQQKEMLWLSTEPGTRAERFYRMQGWRETGMYAKGELKFIMHKNDWKKR